MSKDIVRRAVEDVWGRGDADVAIEVYARDVVDHNAFPGMPPGVDGILRSVRMFNDAFEIAITLEDLVEEGDRVVDRWTALMRHTGEFMGIPATGRTVTLRGIDINRVEHGKIQETWHIEDAASLMQQLGGADGQAAP